MGGFLNCARCVFFIFFVARSLPDRCQIIARSLPDWGDPHARFIFCARFLDFQKKLARVTGHPCQILATIFRLPDCARFWYRIPTWLRQLSERAEDAGGKKKKESSSSLCPWLSSHLQPLPLAAVATPVTTAVIRRQSLSRRRHHRCCSCQRLS